MHREKFVALDWLRFALAIYLVLFHTIRDFAPVDASHWLYSSLSIGFYSTSTFFVLSGFLLAHVYLGEKGNKGVDRGKFWIKRFASLYPIHILALVLVLPLVIINAGGVTNITATPNVNSWAEGLEMSQTTLGADALAGHLLMQITMLHAWFPWFTTFNFATWSLSALFFFYALFPFVAPKLAKTRRPLTVLGVICGVYLLPPLVMFIGNINDNVIAHGLLHRNPLLRLPEFLAGIMLCVVYHRYKPQLGALFGLRGTLLSLAFVIGCFAGAVYLHAEVGGGWYYLLHNGLLLPSQLLLVLMCAWFKPASDTHQARMAARLGVASLSIFALHVPLNMIASKVEKLILASATLMQDGGAFTLSRLISVAEATDRSLWMYPLFLVTVVITCVLFQEQLVNRARFGIQNRLLARRERHTHQVSRRRQALH